MLIKWVCEADPLCCPKCVGQMKVVSFIEPPQVEVIEAILKDCGLRQARAAAHVEYLVLEPDVAFADRSFEYGHGDFEGIKDPHFWSYCDDGGDLMALFCHKNGIDDRCNREGENQAYFRLASGRVSDPLGMNIVPYATTR